MNKHKSHIKLLRTPAITISLLYFSFGMAWINVSDLLVYTFSESPTAEQITQFQTFKGFFFIGITSLLLYILSIRYLNKIAKHQHQTDGVTTELQNIYESTSDGLARIELDGKITRTNNNFREITGLKAKNHITDTIKNTGQLLDSNTLLELRDGTINDHIGTCHNLKVVVSATRDANYEPLYYHVSVR